MVIQRTIENLRERSKDERRAVAMMTASAAVVILFVGWAVFFFRGVRTAANIQNVNDAYAQSVQQMQDAYNSTNNADAEAAAAAATSPSDSVQVIQETPGTFTIGQ